MMEVSSNMLEFSSPICPNLRLKRRFARKSQHRADLRTLFCFFDFPILELEKKSLLHFMPENSSMRLLKKNDIYYIFHRKKHISLGTNDESLAREIFVRVAKELAVQELSGSLSVVSTQLPQSQQQSPMIAIQSVFEEYLAACRIKKFTKYTMRFKADVLRKMQSVHIVTFADVDQSHINAFAESIAGYATDTQRKYITDLMAFLNNSAKKGYIDKECVSRIDLPKFRSKPRELIISNEDWQKIMMYTKAHDLNFYYYLLTLFHTFSRPNEVVGLKGSDFNIQERYIDIFQNKTQKMKRVFLEADYAAEIKQLIDERGSKYLFDFYGKNPESYAKKFKYICKKLNLNPKYILYTIRHTSITYLMNKTNDVEFVARQAGNDPAITMKHYVNRNSQHFLDILDKKI